MKRFNVIVAYCRQSRGIGYKGRLPWKHRIKKDMSRFVSLTKKTKCQKKMNAVIMGRKTWDSLNGTPLAKRFNVILSSNPELYTQTLDPLENNQKEHVSEASNKCSKVQAFNEFDNALKYLSDNRRVESIFVIGGEKLYQIALGHPNCDKIYTTEIIGGEGKDGYQSDTYFPKIPEWFKLRGGTSDIVVDKHDTLTFGVYENKLTHQTSSESGENSYLSCMRDVLHNGELVKDRTNVGTISLFDKNMRFSIDNFPNGEYRIPVITTKSVYIKGVIWELIWFLRGETNAKWLQEKGVRIWDGNTSREYLDSRGLADYEEGEMGPGYGHQWIRWGAKLPRQRPFIRWCSDINEISVIEDKGINQVQGVIDELRANPTSRRALISAWNVADLDKMALPPCHVMYIFKITGHEVGSMKKLNCKMVMRSNDLFLGAPFNILSTALLTILISKALKIQAGDIAISINDAHIYQNHVEQVKEQLTRRPLQFPTLQIKKDINNWEDMTALTPDEFVIKDYHHYPKLSGKMAV